jgi:hypothetical protein
VSTEQENNNENNNVLIANKQWITSLHLHDRPLFSLISLRLFLSITFMFDIANIKLFKGDIEVAGGE